MDTPTPLSTNAAEQARRLKLREAAAQNFQRVPQQEHICWNRFHLVYQYADPKLNYHQFTAEMLEMNDAQFERWLNRMRAARTALRAL